MATLRDIRRRIRSVESTQKITRAMKLVAAAKLRRAQERILAARPYASKMAELLGNLVSAVGGADEAPHPLLVQREGPRRQIVIITADRGLAGAFNSNIIRRALDFIRESNTKEVTLVTVGRKGRDAMRRAGVPIEAHFDGLGDRPTFADVVPLSRLVTEDFLSGDAGRIDIVYSHFVSTLIQRPTSDRLLPIEPSGDTEGIPGHQFIFEPSPAAVLEQLLPRYVATRLYQAVLEAKASEESSRMVAMKNATDNAEDLIEDLTLSYNKVRQANITREMIEIATGAQAR